MKLAIVLIVLIILGILFIYNSLVKSRNKVNQSKSGIDVYLNQRFDLIPNLVQCVKAYSKHENAIFEKVTELRTTYNASKKLNDASKLNSALNTILAIGENYPELKASEQFLNLQRNLTKIESQLQAARRIYNMDVTNFNNKIQTVPTNIFAKIFGFKEAELFQIEEYKKDNINIEM